MKLLQLDGRIGKNGAELKQTSQGKPYIRFTLANNSFANNKEQTEWFDVTCFDQHVIEKRAKLLTKGTYVIVAGTPKTEVNVSPQGKIYVNQYLTAIGIEIPSLSKKKEGEENVVEDVMVSTYTANTQTVTNTQAQASVQPQVVTVGVGGSQNVSIPNMMVNDDDDSLPF